MEKGKDKNPSLRFIPRNLSENLGKLPPQALDLEEMILGAVMLERHALQQISKHLKAEHFYKEAHVQIYNAILSLLSESAPVDMKTVVHKLRETGKIEL